MILEKVAQNAWEKELITKFQKKYLTKQGTMYSHHMYHYNYDQKDDDERLTPKKKTNIDLSKAMQSAAQSNSSYEMESDEREQRHKRQKSD